MSAWDCLTRRAQVLEGPDRRMQRFASLIAALEREARDQQPDPPDPRPASADLRVRARHRRGHHPPRSRHPPPADGSSWDDFVAWASRLFLDYVRPGLSWPAAERAAHHDVGAALDSLRAATAIEPTTTLRGFRTALAAALELRRLPEGARVSGSSWGP